MRIAAAAVLLSALLAACATVGEVDLSDEACAATFRRQIASILAGQGEEPDEAETMAQRAVVGMGFGPGLRPFVVGSRTTDYTFFVDRKKTGCLLRLLSRERGLVRYSNDVTYIDSRPLPGCRCAS